MMIPTIEKRSCSRFKIENAKVKIKKAGMFSFLRFFSKSYSLVNISKAGLAFMYEKKIKRSSKIIIKLRVPKMKPVYLIGLVRWQGKRSDSSQLHVGVEFLSFGTRLGHNTLDALEELRKLEAIYSKK